MLVARRWRCCTFRFRLASLTTEHVSNIGLGAFGVDVVTCPGLRRAVANAMEAVRARLLGLSLQAREFCEQVGLPLELDTDGIW